MKVSNKVFLLELDEMSGISIFQGIYDSEGAALESLAGAGLTGNFLPVHAWVLTDDQQERNPFAAELLDGGPEYDATGSLPAGILPPADQEAAIYLDAVLKMAVPVNLVPEPYKRSVLATLYQACGTVTGVPPVERYYRGNDPLQMAADDFNNFNTSTNVQRAQKSTDQGKATTKGKPTPNVPGGSKEGGKTSKQQNRDAKKETAKKGS